MGRAFPPGRDWIWREQNSWLGLWGPVRLEDVKATLGISGFAVQMHISLLVGRRHGPWYQVAWVRCPLQGPDWSMKSCSGVVGGDAEMQMSGHPSPRILVQLVVGKV